MTMKRFVSWYPVMVLMTIDLAFAIANILLKKIVSNGTDHLVFITFRQAISAIFLSPLAYFLERGKRPKLTGTILWQLFVSAIIGASVTQYLFLLGIEYTSATFSCAFLNMVPVVTFFMALPFRLESVDINHSGGIAKVVGAVICLGGAILLTAYKGIPLFHFSQDDQVTRSTGQHYTEISPSIVRLRWAIGSLALFAATICWSSWFILQSYIGKKYPCQYSSTAIMTFFSAIQSAIIGLSFQRDLSVWIFKNKTDIYIALYAGMIGSGLCFVGMTWCVKKKGPVFTAAFSPLVQIMSAAFEVPVLHEQLHLGSLMGSVAIVVGLYILLWGKDKEIKQQQKKNNGLELVSSPHNQTEVDQKDSNTDFQPTKLQV
ncbi:WAT1-related protein At3g30340-like [Andrographis paniculata]|uniref:WAT1-related protein At3g30340-like n=1 Tax=Andrographis paniculata TaxID=175694 RepID=UPI0021E76498|nr:WAT1-related protein At3g30340-like [Andrographis paniculata]